MSLICTALCASFWVVSLPIAQLQVFKHIEGKNSLACFGCLTINTSASGTEERMRKWVFCFYKLCLSSSSLWSILLHKWIGWGHYRTSRDNNNVLLDNLRGDHTKGHLLNDRAFILQFIWNLYSLFLNWTNASFVISVPFHFVAAMGFLLWSDPECNVVKVLSA